MMTDEGTDPTRYGSITGSEVGREDQEYQEDHSSDPYDFESIEDSLATENDTGDLDSDGQNSSNNPVVKVKTLVEYHLEFLTKHPGEVFFYGCKLCTHRFTSRNSFLIHMKLHNVRKRYPCDYCDKAYDRKFQLVHHLRLHTSETPFECEVCFVAYAREEELSAHSRVHTSDKPFECRFCLKGFPQKKALIVHLRMHTGERPFPCQLCDRTFTQKAHLQGHMVRIHIPKKKVDYHRLESSHSLVEAQAERGHSLGLMRTGAGAAGAQEPMELEGDAEESDVAAMPEQREKLISCDYCDKKFTYERNKTNHMKKHGLGGGGEPLYECDACQRAFPSRPVLEAHLLTHLGLPPSNNNAPPFRCDICAREFNMKRNLIMHVKSHNNERPFECPACEKSFKLKYFLELHITRIHPHIKLEDLPHATTQNPVIQSAHIKKQLMLHNEMLKNDVVNVAAAQQQSFTPNKRKQSQPKKVVVRMEDEYYDSDESDPTSYGEYSSDSEREMKFDPAKFVQVFVNEPKNLSFKKDESVIAKSMQINLPHDLQHVKKLLNAKTPAPPPVPSPAMFPGVQSKPLQCPMCPTTLPNRALLTLHLREHDRSKPHQCPMCEKVYIQLASFEKHMKKHMLEGLLEQSVLLQSDALSGENKNLLDQYRMASLDGKKPLECKICKKKYAQPASFEKHMRQHFELGDVEPMAFNNSIFEKLEGVTGTKMAAKVGEVAGKDAGTGTSFINPSDFLEVSFEHS